MAAVNAKPTLESIVTRYRRESVRTDGITPELEIRLQDVTYENFAAIYNALISKKDTESTLTQMVSIIMIVGKADHQSAQRPMRIREIFFENGQRTKTQYVQKIPLTIPFRVHSQTGISYIVALSSEQTGAQSFSSDEGALIRIKARVSFKLNVSGMLWRIDMTVTRQIMGSDASSSLKQIIAQMFATKPIMTPETFLDALNIESDTSLRIIYRYEVEAEYVGVGDDIKPTIVTAAADTILLMANPEFSKEAAMQAEIYYIAKYVVKAPGYLQRFRSELGLKRLLPQALSITRADYREIYPPVGYYLTEKADGKRAVAIAHDTYAVIISDTIITFNSLSAVQSGKASGVLDTIVDGELVTDENNVNTFYAFDVIAVLGKNMTTETFEKRLDRLGEAVKILKLLGLPIVAKGYTHINNGSPVDLQRIINSTYNRDHPYEIDGLIFVEPDKPYDETSNYKWKPTNHNTIDMLARRAPPSVLGKEPFIDKPDHKLYFLFVGINPNLYYSLGLQRCQGYSDLFGEARNANYFPIQFSPSDAPFAYMYQHPDKSGTEIDGKIIEVRCSGGCEAAGNGSVPVKWEMTRIRDDRRRELASGNYFGNDMAAAEGNWLNYVDPFPIDQLWDGPSLDYFMKAKSDIYKAQTGVISFVKNERIATLKHSSWVVDIGIGKGQDLSRYFDAEIQHLVAVDADRAALSELVRRKYNFAKRSIAKDDSRDHGAFRRDRDWKVRSSTVVHVLAADANDPFAQTLDKFEVFGLFRMKADALICNLAVHYFLSNIMSMRNFILLARNAVKIGGQVILTILNGEIVHKTFLDSHIVKGGSWDIFEGVVRKYSLKRLYSSDNLEDAGQRIGVILPFSDGKYYEEFLVNPKTITAEFSSRGFSLLASTNVASSIPEFEAHNRVLANKLTDGDRKWLSIYGELIFRRDK